MTNKEEMRVESPSFASLWSIVDKQNFGEKLCLQKIFTFRKLSVNNYLTFFA